MKVRLHLKPWHKQVLIILLIGIVGNMVISAYDSILGRITGNWDSFLFAFLMFLIAGTITFLHFIRWSNRWMRR